MKTEPAQPRTEADSDPPRRRIANREFEVGEIEAAREFYFQFGPGREFEVVRQMIAAGWKRFGLSKLCGSRFAGTVGLVKAFGWDEEWRQLQPQDEPPTGADTVPEEIVPPTYGQAFDDLSAGNDESVESSIQIRDASPAIVETNVEIKFNKHDTEFQRWLKLTKPEWCWDWRFQRTIFRTLNCVVKRRVRRVMIFLPPRHGKSELVTVRFAAWMLRRDPATRIVVGSYNQKLANRFSRHIKAIYQGLSEAETEMEEKELVLKRSDEWETRAGGGVKAVGAGCGITGFGADLIVIDDPVRSRADAESANNRDRVWEWFTDDLMTRLEPGGAVILIQTRWHEDDLAGRLLARVESGESRIESGRKIEKWEVICLPALAEDDDPLRRKPGAALCPERFSAADLLAKKEEMGSYSFAALYQQRPVPDAGGLFKRDWFTRVVDRAPEGLKWFRGYDLAVSVKETADYTASARIALDKDGTLYIADVFRKRIEYPDQRRYVLERLAAERRDTEHGIELAVHGHAFVQDLLRDAGAAATAFRGVRVAGDKFTRALAWANRAEAGKIALVRGGWIDDFIEEACRFPQGKHDDQIDAVSLAVQMMTARKRRGWSF